ncbi:hypothetical protein Godav_029349, partial [Gossypium davidsonii]|nr:hypothetical protein [Gossypium davidsonii]
WLVVVVVAAAAAVVVVSKNGCHWFKAVVEEFLHQFTMEICCALEAWAPEPHVSFSFKRSFIMAESQFFFYTIMVSTHTTFGINEYLINS